MPRLCVLAGPSVDKLTPIDVNSGIPIKIKTDAFEGEVAVFIKGLEDPDTGVARDTDYFRKRSGVTWSIQVQGRFLREYSADDILFGNVFDRPFKLPWGFSAALKFMHFIDPTLEHDLASRTRPWALSPLIATMPYFQHRRTAPGVPTPAFPPSEPLSDDVSQLRTTPGAVARPAKPRETPSKRRGHYANALRRQEVVFGPEDLITTDFCYDFLQFRHEGVTLRLPGGISIDLMKYWDGQPVRFVCCERLPKGQRTQERPWGRVLWAVVIEPAEDASSEGGSVQEKGWSLESLSMGAGGSVGGSSASEVD